MRLIDHVVRQGHLSERALFDALTDGTQPAHLDRCDICAERAAELSRWLNQLQTDAVEVADRIFTAERLTAQQAQVLRRLEHLDSPARVISFPAAARLSRPELSGRRVAVSWVGIAAAAGLVIGLVGGQLSERLLEPPALANPPLAVDTTPVDSGLLGQPYDTLEISSFDVLNEMTPRLNQIATNSGG